MTVHSRASITSTLGDGFIHFLDGNDASSSGKDSHEFLESPLSDGYDAHRALLNFKTQPVASLEIELFSNIRRDGHLPFTSDGGTGFLVAIQ